MSSLETTAAAPGLTPGGEALLETRGLTRHFNLGGPFSRRMLHAVDDVDLSIKEREIVSLVGESGSGKTTVARLLALAYTPSRGKIIYRGREVNRLRGRRDLLWYRGEVPMVFQDPYSAMNPVYRVAHSVLRQLRLHRPELGAAERRVEAERIFDQVGLSPEILDKFPYEMSGGQRQRVGFAQALAVQPRLILADEPVSMLDVSIRAGVLNLMTDLRQAAGVSILYITHDVASARYVSDRIVVMYAGMLVEGGPAEDVLARPKHPYTQLLVANVPDPRDKSNPATGDSGEPPKVINPTEGCRFRWRCPLAIDVCYTVTPKMRQMGPDHGAACHVAVPGPEATPSVPGADSESAPAAASGSAPAGTGS